MCGIYKITNKLNGKCYIGQSIDIIQRWRHHRNYPKSISHYPLYLAFQEYGLENFTFEVLEECDIQELDIKEQFYIQKYHSYSNGYNQTIGGQSAGHVVKLTDEDVQVIYDLLQYSSVSQNEIAALFTVGVDTISEINHGKTRRKDGMIYPLRNNHKKKTYCIDCGKEISTGSTRCAVCRAKADRAVNRPNREELKFLIRTTPFTTIGARYGVTDNAVRKWCDAEGLPRTKTKIKQFSDLEWQTL